MEEIWQPYSEPTFINSDDLQVAQSINSKMMFARINIRSTDTDSTIPNITNLIFVDKNEAKTFLTAKRAEEHASGRYLLQNILLKWDSYLDLSQIEVKRESSTRKPYLSWIEGTYQGKQLPEFSISHSNGIAMVALCDNEHVIGLDIEPLNEERSENLMEFVSEGNELKYLRNNWMKNSKHGNQILNHVWTIKESCMKSLGIGMGINPITIKIPENILKNFSIEKSNFQLKYFGEIIDVCNSTMSCSDQYSISISIRKKRISERPTLNRAEQEMYESLQSSADIGCSIN